jgi:hypothetical protein
MRIIQNIYKKIISLANIQLFGTGSASGYALRLKVWTRIETNADSKPCPPVQYGTALATLVASGK